MIQTINNELNLYVLWYINSKKNGKITRKYTFFKQKLKTTRMPKRTKMSKQTTYIQKNIYKID